MIKTLTLSLLLAIVTTSFARIGETSMQCFERYGRVVEEKYLGDAKQIEFHSDDFTVTGIFVADKAEYLKFTKSGKLSEAEVESLLEKNGIERPLAEEHRKKVRTDYSIGEEITWTFQNLMANLSPLGNSLWICTMEFAHAVRNVDEAVEKQKADKSLNGF